MATLTKRIAAMLLGVIAACVVCEDVRAQDDLAEQLKHDYMVMSRYYLFVRDDPSSAVLRISLDQGKGYPHVWRINHQSIYVDVSIWWPGIDWAKISRKDIVTSAILPALCMPINYISRAERNAHTACMALMNPENGHAAPSGFEQINSWRKQYGARKTYKKLADLNGPSFQHIDINEIALERIRKLYPRMPAPIGIYMCYWSDPVIYDFAQPVIGCWIEYHPSD